MNGDLSASLLRATLESTADGILVLTNDRNTPVYNQKFVQMWRIPEYLMQPGFADERLAFLSSQMKDGQGFVDRVWELFRQRPHETALDLLEFKDGRIFERYSQPLRNGDEIIGRVWSYRDITERRRTETALQRQATAIQASIDGIAILDAHQNYIYLNQSHARIYGYDSAQDLIGKNWKLLYDRRELERFEQDVFPEFKRTGQWRGEAIGRRRDGSQFPQEVSLSAIQGGGLVCIVRDVSDRKQHQVEYERAIVALRQSEERLRLTLDFSRIGIWDWDICTGELTASEESVRLIGREPGAVDISYQLWRDVVHPDDIEQVEQSLAHALQTHTDYEAEYRVIYPDQSIHWIAARGRSIYDEAGQPLHMLGVLICITDRKLAEEALRQSETRFRALYDATSMAAFLLDETGCFDCNQAAAQLFRCSRESLLGSAPSDFSPRLQPGNQDSVTLAQQHLVTALAQGSHHFEWVHRRADGSEFPAEVWLTAVEVGDRPFIQAMVQDLTERKQIEAALAERANLAAFRADVGKALAEGDTLQTILQQCAEAMIDHLNAAFARIWLLNQREDVLELQASAGIHTSIAAPYSRIPVPRSTSQPASQNEGRVTGQQTCHKIEQIFQTGQPVMTNAVLDDPMIPDRAWAQQHSLTAFAGYPLVLGDQVLGVVMMFARQPLTESSLEALGFAASEIALGIRRKQAEAALRESETRFRAIFESAAIGVSQTGLDGRILKVNPALQRMLGYSETELYTMHYKDYTHPHDVATDLELTQELINGQRESFQMEKRFIRKDHSLIWTRLTVSSVNSSEGDILFTVALIEDISEQKRLEAERQEAEAALQQSELKFRAIVENANDIIYVQTADGFFDYISPNVAAILGYTPTELEQQSFAVLVHPDEEENCRAILKRVIELGEKQHNLELRVIHKNGSWRWFSCNESPMIDADGQIKIMGVARDITDRRQSEEALRQAHQQLEFHIANSPLAVIKWCHDGRLGYWSPQAERIFGWSAEEVLGKTWDDWSFIYEADYPKVRQIVERLSNGQEQYNICSNRNYAKDGRIVECEWYNSVLLDETGNMVSIFSLVQDVTQRKQTEEALRRSELKYRNLFENSQVGILRTRVDDGLILEANQRFIEQIGYQSVTEVVGIRSSLEFYNDASDRQWLLDRVFKYGECNNYEMPFRYRDGSTRWALCSVRLNQEDHCLEIVSTDITDRKLTEEALRRSELKYRNIFENSQVGIGRTRLDDGLFLEVNQRYAEIMGFNSPAELVGKRFTSEFYANLSDRQKILAELKQRGEVHNFEEQLRCPDGTTTWGLLSIRLNQEEGCLDFVIADITDRKRLEEELRQSQQFLDSIIDNIPLGLFVKDIRNDFRYVLINKNSDRFLGFSRDVGIGRNDYELTTKERADFYYEQDRTAVNQGSLLQIPDFSIAVGNETMLSRSMKLPIFDPQGNPTHLLCINEDITERKRREEALRLIVEGTAAKTGDDFFRTCVRYLAEVLQVHCAFVTELSDRSHTRARILAIWLGGNFGGNFEFDLTGTPCEHVARGEQIYLFPENVPALFPDDPYISVLKAESYLGIPLLNASGKMLGYLAVTDTKPMQPDPGRELILKIFAARAGAELERQQAENALKLAKEAAEAANRAKSTFLANMSHELRTPLNSILGFAQLMTRDTSLLPQQRNFLETINRSGEHLLGLINDVLEMSKIEAGRVVLNPVSFDLHQLLYSLQEMFQIRTASKQLTLECTVSSNLPQYVFTDEGKLRQVLINLLSNAVKFTDRGGIALRVSIQDVNYRVQRTGETPESLKQRETETLQTKIHHLKSAVSQSYTVRFEVEDTGCGIAPEEINKLFQPFVQTTSGSQAREGSGLGLTISRQFVQLMGGDIRITSRVGQGSCFRFTIPVTLADPADVAVPFSRKRVLGVAPDQPSYRILVVDDRPENRDLIAQLLTSTGFETRTANDGAEAIAEWRTWHPHLIWMDMRMPVMDGYEATRRIRDVESRALTCVNNTTKIIALTASAFEEQRSTILAAGCNDLVSKPFKEHEIFEKMAEHLGVQYVYEAEQQPVSTIPQTPPEAEGATFTLSSRSFRNLSADWLTQLQNAALAVDADQIFQLIEQIPARDRPLADALRDLVQRFCFDEVLELLQDADQN